MSKTAVGGKVDGLRALREAKYERERMRAAPKPRKVKPRKSTPVQTECGRVKPQEPELMCRKEKDHASRHVYTA